MATPLLLIPSDVLNPKRPDEHFAAEWQAAREAGLAITLVDHDALARPGGAAAGVRGVAGEEPHLAVYRGWMLTADRYDDLSRALEPRNVKLVTTPAAFARAHELPGWYAAIADQTPRSVWTVGAERGSFEVAAPELGARAAALRHYSRSL